MTARPLSLIVEDHAPTRRAMARLLGQIGWDVVAAGTIAEGIAALDRHPVILILDLMLPDGDGEEILRRVREAGLPTRIAITTATGDSDRLDAVRRLGPVDLLPKPVSFDEVCRICDPALTA